ncbi:hypothetical protein BGZ82_005343, partial [Podila clonocystis]
RFVMSTMTETTVLMGLEFSTTSNLLCLIVLSRDVSLVMPDIMDQSDMDHLKVFRQISKTQEKNKKKRRRKRSRWTSRSKKRRTMMMIV